MRGGWADVDCVRFDIDDAVISEHVELDDVDAVQVLLDRFVTHLAGCASEDG